MLQLPPPGHCTNKYRNVLPLKETLLANVITRRRHVACCKAEPPREQLGVGAQTGAAEAHDDTRSRSCGLRVGGQCAGGPRGPPVCWPLPAGKGTVR